MIRSIRRPKLTLGGIGWILVLGFLALRIYPQLRAAAGIGGSERQAPAFMVETLDGTSIDAETLRGKVVLVNFWATWCPPCRVEMPGFQRVYEARRDEGFVVLGLSTDRGSVRAVGEFVRDRQLTFPVAMAPKPVVRAFGGVRALPTSFLIDRNGVIRQEVTGLFAEPALRLAVSHLLAEPYDSTGSGGER
ncbi:MAG TPA: TlpA disulfide reductase family protein [Longimicrobiales bacterium]|nr:TlpA disulfide reductase family protein [Longimicrobiales bacterium]